MKFSCACLNVKVHVVDEPVADVVVEESSLVAPSAAVSVAPATTTTTSSPPTTTTTIPTTFPIRGAHTLASMAGISVVILALEGWGMGSEGTDASLLIDSN